MTNTWTRFTDTLRQTKDSGDLSAQLDAARIPLRGEIAVEDTWDLSLLFPHDAAWETALKELIEQTPKISAFQGTLTTSSASLLEALEFVKQLELSLERIYHFASLRESEDSSNADNLDKIARAENAYMSVLTLSAYIKPEILTLSDEEFTRFVQDPILKDWKTYLTRIHRQRPHTLTPSEERILALGSIAVSGHSTTYSQLTNVDLNYGTIQNEKGETVPVTQSTFSELLYNPHREVRKAAFHSYYKEIDEHKFGLASTLSHSVKADVFHARAKNYPDSLQAALFGNNIPTSVYKNLIQSVRDSLAPLYKYYELRRKTLKIDQIHHYDTYVPMVDEVKKITSWDDAVSLVIASLQPLGEEYCSTLEEGLRGRWCDRYESKGKRSGAFSSSSYSNPPYILMNYKKDVFTDVYTLAHEAGHSMHTWYSQKYQNFQDYNYPIFSAEVASTFNEELLTHYLLEQTTDPRMRAYLLNRQIDDIRATLYRQTMFAEFELRIHEIEEAGEALTLDVFQKEYRKLLDLYFGPDFTIDKELELEFLRIPHFYSAFYVYQYATGISAAISLSQQVLHGGTIETENYLGFLKSGGSREPIETLTRAGVNMLEPEPIKNALALFSQRIDELTELLA